MVSVKPLSVSIYETNAAYGFLEAAQMVEWAYRNGFVGYMPWLPPDYRKMFYDIFSEREGSVRYLSFENNEHRLMSLLLCAAICNEI